ncbi:YtxH domain-containing protein [Pedobacter sp.]|nr:YtxH domain-containing protein [Candidatus Saccharibacteria bacterium]
MTKNKSFGVVLVAGLIGAAVGLLFAPKSGKETREDLRKKAMDAKKSAADASKKATTSVKETTDDVQNSLKQSAKEMNDLGEKAKVRASRIADHALFTIARAEENARRRVKSEVSSRPPIL